MLFPLTRRIFAGRNRTYNHTSKYMEQNLEQTGEIVMYQPDEIIRLEVRMSDETVWLTQAQMAELFQTDRTSIVRHVNNIYKTGELEQESTCAKIAQVQIEGKRTIKRMILYFNLDMIISVGYRVNSKRGVKFRQWANSVLKDVPLRNRRDKPVHMIHATLHNTLPTASLPLGSSNRFE